MGTPGFYSTGGTYVLFRLPHSGAGSFRNIALPPKPSCAELRLMSPKPLTGGCLCGQVCYEAAGWPYNVAHCHCEDCRRASGAPFVTWASFKRADFRFTRGQPRQVHWANRIRSFCPDCGTALTFLASEEAEELDVTVASLDDSKALQPAAHIWVEDKLPWVKLADGLPTHPRSRT